MKKKFVYQVGPWEFVGYEAFGKAWQDAKAKATEMHSAIYRLVIKGEEVKQEAFLKAGCFLNVEFVEPEHVKIF